MEVVARAVAAKEMEVEVMVVKETEVEAMVAVMEGREGKEGKEGKVGVDNAPMSGMLLCHWWKSRIELDRYLLYRGAVSRGYRCCQLHL